MRVHSNVSWIHEYSSILLSDIIVIDVVCTHHGQVIVFDTIDFIPYYDSVALPRTSVLKGGYCNRYNPGVGTCTGGLTPVNYPLTTLSSRDGPRGQSSALGGWPPW